MSCGCWLGSGVSWRLNLGGGGGCNQCWGGMRGVVDAHGVWKLIWQFVFIQAYFFTEIKTIYFVTKIYFLGCSMFANSKVKFIGNLPWQISLEPSTALTFLWQWIRSSCFKFNCWRWCDPAKYILAPLLGNILTRTGDLMEQISAGISFISWIGEIAWYASDRES